MAKKNNKNASRGMRIQMQQRLKQIENAQFQTILRFTKACNTYDQFMKLPASELTYIKKIQFRSVWIKADKGSGISEAIIAAVKKDFSDYLHSKKITIEGSDEQFTMHDLVTAGQTLWQATRFSSDERMKAIYEKQGPLNYFFDHSTETLFVNIIFQFLQDLVDKFSRVDKYFLWFTWKLDYQNNHMAAVFVLHRQNCIRKHIMFDKKRRPVFRVGWAVEYEGMRWAEVQGEKLIPFCSDVDVSRSYPVFVQSHALERMKERLNPIPQHDVLLNLSFERGELSRNVAGQLLIAVRFNECKLGYLLADFVENQLVVRSFLFITHTGTSEGNAFNERLRIQSYSKKYFALDSLITYIVTDICIDPFFRAVLTECGCEDLIKFRQLFSIEIKDGDKFSENLRRELALVDERNEIPQEMEEC